MPENRNTNINLIMKFLNNYAWVSTFIAFVIGILLGSGSLWQFQNIKISKQKYELDRVKLMNDQRMQLLALQDQIIGNTKEYIDIRDKYYRVTVIEKSADNKNSEYELQNKYYPLMLKMIKLITDYNVLELELSTLEKRAPSFFPVQAIIPPLPPKNIRIEYRENGKVFLVSDPPDTDAVVKGVFNNLNKMSKLKLTNQTSTVEVEKK